MMIKVTNLNKYYNKNKANEIHVINNISLEFPNTGLVALLGPSGSGKTTLLNAIGGLDSVNKGTITINDETISKYNHKKWDLIRNRHVGYIFQNYNLLHEETVYDNIAFTLKMCGITDKETIDKRIDFALKCVNMQKYQKRKAGHLSGGQMQRIAIARALVKRPDVIIADEPTGNLDEKNTIEIMNIIKQISKECLVILVTHEKKIANFYGDRIIELLDGKIVKDYLNSNSDKLTYSQDTNIYLKEYSKKSLINDNLELNYYFDKNDKNIKVDIIFNNGKLYIDVPKDSIDIKLVSNEEVNVIDDFKPNLSKEELTKKEINLKDIEKFDIINKQVIKFKDTLLMGFKKLLNYKRSQKIFLTGFFLSAIMIVLSNVFLCSSLIVNEKDFVRYDKHLLSIINSNNINVDDLLEYKSMNNVEYINNTNMMRLNITNDFFMQTRNVSLCLNDYGSSIIPINKIKEKDLILGSMPESKYDIVIDKWVLDILLANTNFKISGIDSYDDFINKIYEINYKKIGKITGVVDTNNPSIYMDKDLYQLQFLNATYNITSDSFKDLFTTNYQEVLKEDEVLLRKSLYDLMMDKSQTEIEYFNETFKIAGYFESNDNLFIEYIFSNATIDKVFLKNLIDNNSLNIYSNDKDKTIKDFSEKGINLQDDYANSLERYKFNKQLQIISQLVFTTIVFVASLIFLFLIIRTSLITRIYEVGVYRSLGVTKLDIYKIFTAEIVSITLVTSTVGYILASIFVYYLKIKYNFASLSYPWYAFILGLLFIYVINILIGLIPIRKLLRKTPAEILSKYDI